MEGLFCVARLSRNSGCPTLATLLFLSLGWAGMKLALQKKNLPYLSVHE
jgi:hypothetical protein